MIIIDTGYSYFEVNESRDSFRVPNELQTVYRDGKLLRRTSLSDIRANATLGLYD